ncbi:hypothetical protein ACJX0J_031537, partial [Zea mays]
DAPPQHQNFHMFIYVLEFRKCFLIFMMKLKCSMPLENYMLVKQVFENILHDKIELLTRIDVTPNRYSNLKLAMLANHLCLAVINKGLFCLLLTFFPFRNRIQEITSARLPKEVPNIIYTTLVLMIDDHHNNLS